MAIHLDADGTSGRDHADLALFKRISVDRDRAADHDDVFFMNRLAEIVLAGQDNPDSGAEAGLVGESQALDLASEVRVVGDGFGGLVVGHLYLLGLFTSVVCASEVS